MRLHRNYEQLMLWTDPQELRAFVRASQITAARLQPVIRQSLEQTTLDIVFKKHGRYITVPLIIVDSPHLVARESDRFVWPETVARAISDDAAVEIEQFLFPWLRSITLGRSLSDEVIRHFGDGQDRSWFEAARQARFVGAATLEESVLALAPYAYGARFAAGKNVLIAGAADAIQGAAFLARHASSIRIREIHPEDEKLAAAWFDWPPRHSEFGSIDAVFFGPERSAGFDQVLSKTSVEILIDTRAEALPEQVIAAQVFPLDILFTNETLHGPPARYFSVHVPEVAIPPRAAPVMRHGPVGGSSGRILFGLRPNYATAGDSDVDSALVLAGMLRDEGFVVDLSAEPLTCDYASYDIVHCFNLIDIPNTAAFLANAKRSGVRTVLTATFLDIPAEKRHWGADTHPMCFNQEIDEASMWHYLSFLERRALLAPGWDETDAERRGPFPSYDSTVQSVLSLCDLVIAESEPEAALLRSRGYGGALEVIPPFLQRPATTKARPPVAYENFALLHAPLEQRNNQLLAVRAARNAGVPLVLAGHATDMAYAARIRECAGDLVTVTDPQDGALDWLYARAATIVDNSWYAYGTARLWRSVLSGATVCASSSGWGPSLWPPGTIAPVDPAVPATLEAAMAASRAPNLETRGGFARSLEPGVLLRKVLLAYAGGRTAPVNA